MHDIMKLTDYVISGGTLDEAQCATLWDADGHLVYQLFAGAARIRDHFVGGTIHLCSILNAKSGRCPENCSFCAQSAFHKTDAPVYGLVDEDKIVAAAKESEEMGSCCYGIITSGTSVRKGEELDRILRAVRRIRTETSISPSCSLGIIDEETAAELKEAGVETYHHNLETARSYFPNVCTTHDYELDVETVRAAKKAGMKVCCGGIFGLGESPAQRIEMAMTLRDLDVDNVPINFLNPIEGTRLEKAQNLTPMECLKIIALYRFILPGKQISVCGGREKNLRDLQSWIFFAGASGMMIGNYLTTTGRNPAHDHQMLADLGLQFQECGNER